MIAYERLEGTTDVDSMFVDPSIEAFPAPLQLHLPMPPVTNVPFATQTTSKLILQTRAHMGSVRLFHCFPIVPSYFFHDTVPYLRFYEPVPLPPVSVTATLLELLGGDGLMEGFRVMLEKSKHASTLVCKYFFFWATRYWLLVRGFFLQLRTTSAELYLDGFLPSLSILLPTAIQFKPATGPLLVLSTSTDAEVRKAAQDETLCTFATTIMCLAFAHLEPKARMAPWRDWAENLCKAPSTLLPSCRFREVYTDGQRFKRVPVQTTAHRLAKVHAAAEGEPSFFAHMSFSPRHPILVPGDWNPDYMAWQLFFYASFEELASMGSSCEYMRKLMSTSQLRDGRIQLTSVPEGQEKERFPREFARHRFSFFFSPFKGDTRAYLFIPALIRAGTSRLPDESDVRFLSEEAWEWAATSMPRPCLSIDAAWKRALDEGRFRVGTEMTLAIGEHRVCSNLILRCKSTVTAPFNEWQQRLLTRAWTERHTLAVNCYYFMYIVQLITGSERVGIASVAAKGFTRQQVYSAYLDHERSIDTSRSPFLHAHTQQHYDIPTPISVDASLHPPLHPSWVIARALQWLRPSSILLVNRPRFTDTPAHPCTWLQYFEEEVPLYVVRSAMRDFATNLLSANVWPHIAASAKAQILRPEMRALVTFILPTSVLPHQHRLQICNALGAPLDVTNSVEDKCARIIEFERFFRPGRTILPDTYQLIQANIVQSSPHLAGAIARMFSLGARVDGFDIPPDLAEVGASVSGIPPPVAVAIPETGETHGSPIATEDIGMTDPEDMMLVDPVTLSLLSSSPLGPFCLQVEEGECPKKSPSLSGALPATQPESKSG